MSCATSEANTASPKPTRTSSERRPLAPVTPQRLNRASKQTRAASSPLTPSNSSLVSSPFTPITNFYSSSSSVASPNSSVSTKVEFSPEFTKSKLKSVADATHNWRTRAKENGIKVTAEEHKKDTQAISKDTIPASFLSTHRRSRQALFQTKSSDSTAFISPKTARMPIADGVAATPVFSTSSLSASLLSTPEPSRLNSGPFDLTTPSPRTSQAIVQKLRQRGSLTEPARPRRREPFGASSGDILFDIDENAPATYSPYSQSFGSPISISANSSPFSGARCVSAPFMPGRYRAELDEDEEDDDVEDDGLPSAPKPSTLRVTRSASSLPIHGPQYDKSSDPKVAGIVDTKVCSVCSAASSPLSTLIPCEHLICSSCLTGALNIIGEKDMRCATCDRAVNDFKLLSPLRLNITESNEAGNETKGDTKGTEETLKLLPSAFEKSSIHEGETKLVNDAQDDGMATQNSTAAVRPHADGGKPTDAAVLRIDNVPWDITPPALTDFFVPHQLVRAHVLLDPRGKTLSHAYVEVSVSGARDALRAVQNKTMGKGRRMRGVTVTMSSQSELMRALFPSWLGSFDGAQPSLNGLDHSGVIRTLENGLLMLPEVDNLVALMRNPKSHFLKVPSLPFYSLISILSKFPTDVDSRVFWSAKLRDVLYDVAVAASQMLVIRIGSELHDQLLLEETVKVTVNCEVFTETQRLRLRELVETSVSVRGGELSCIPPPSLSAMSKSASTTASSRSEEATTPDDSASSSASTSSDRDGGQHQRLGNGRPIRRVEGAYPFANVSAFHSPAHIHLGALASPPHINTPVLGFGNINMSMGMQYSMNSPPQSPYDILAREFGVETDLVAALAHRLALAGPTSFFGQRM